MRISEEQYQAAYQVVTDVFRGRGTIGVGANRLHADYGLNINSAKDYINDLST